jgi:hypothetical protein
MSLSDLTSITGAVSAISVLVSLLFLKVQVRQSEKNQRAMIQQGRASRSAEIAMRLMASDFAEAYYRGMNGETDISETQLVQFMGYCRAVFLGAEDSFLQHKESLLDEQAFVSFTTSLRALFVSPGFRSMWMTTRECYEAEFISFMDTLVKEASNLPSFNPHTQWKKVVSVVNGYSKAA